jgi:hypothetical protein
MLAAGGALVVSFTLSKVARAVSAVSSSIASGGRASWSAAS